MNYNSNYNDDNAFKSQCFALILNAYVCSVLSYINNYNVNNVNNNVNNVNNNDADTGEEINKVNFPTFNKVC